MKYTYKMVFIIYKWNSTYFLVYLLFNINIEYIASYELFINCYLQEKYVKNVSARVT